MPDVLNNKKNSGKQREIWMSTGGTGGHLFPALACADEMMQLDRDLKICLIGGGVKLALSSQVNSPQGVYPYMYVPSGSLSLRSPLKSIQGLLAIGRGTYSAYSAMRAARPDAVVGFGSYFSLPPILAARLMKIPLFLHAADSIPGKVIRHFSRCAECTFLSFPEAASSMKGESCHVKMALRPNMRKGRYTRAEAAQLLGLREDLPTLLVFGGSQGARRLNETLYAAIEKSAGDMPTMQILHYTGDENMVAPLQELYAQKGHRSLVKKYEERMDLAWTLADAAITRSGASTLAELIEHEVPSLLIPYPYAADNHQEKNARSLLQAGVGAGAGVEMIVERELTTDGLVSAMKRMVHNAVYREQMSRALALYKRNAPEETMAEQVLKRVYG